MSGDNRRFIDEFMRDKYQNQSPVKGSELEIQKAEWTPKSRRTGVIARNIGIYPIWESDGTRTLCTLLHV